MEHDGPCKVLSREKAELYFSEGDKARPSESGSAELSSSLDDVKLSKSSIVHAARPPRLTLPGETTSQAEVPAVERTVIGDSASSSPSQSPRASEVCSYQSLSCPMAQFWK